MLLQKSLMSCAAFWRQASQSSVRTSPRHIPRTKARSTPLPFDRLAKPPVEAAEDGRASKSATMLPWKILFPVSLKDDGGERAAGEGGGVGQSYDVGTFLAEF